MKTKLFLSVILFFICDILTAKIRFENPLINNNDEVIFTVENDISGVPSYKTLFRSKIKDNSNVIDSEILTFFPEKMEVVDNGKKLQIRNRYGTILYDLQKKIFEWQNTITDIPTTSQKTPKYSVSFDGKWICYVEKTKYATGRLLLKNVEMGKAYVLDENAKFSFTKLPCKWQSSANILLYEKDDAIYFCNPEAFSKGIEVSEIHRKICDGTIESVNWADDKYFVYIDGDIVYRINSKELYTLGLYSKIIGRGDVIGRLLQNFDAKTDYFSVNHDMSSLVVVQNSRNFINYKLQGKTADFLEVLASIIYSNISEAFLDSHIIWPTTYQAEYLALSDDATPLVLLETMPFDKKTKKTSIYKIDSKFTQVFSSDSTFSPVLSLDNTKCVFSIGDTTYIYDTATWTKQNEIQGEKMISASWLNNNEVFIGGEKNIKKWTLTNNTTETIALSQCQNAFWTPEGFLVAEADTGNYYIFDEKLKFWQKNDNVTADNKIYTQNAHYRVFLGETQNLLFENALYVRFLKTEPITVAIFQNSTKKSDTDKKVAFVIDAYNNTDGLAKILNLLNKHKFKATFFINGEFIRRYPNETMQIAKSGNECASMFFTDAKFDIKDFVITEDFIRRGLAKNEDEFFSITGKELSLLWHAPYNVKSDKIVEAGKKSGYQYVDTIKFSNAFQEAFDTAENQINAYMSNLQKNSGGIVPILTGGSNKYSIYNHLDLLISAILDAGYEVVDVRELLENR